MFSRINGARCVGGSITMVARGTGLREAFLARICKKLGVATTALNTGQKQFLLVRIDDLIDAGASRNSDLVKLAKKFTEVYPAVVGRTLQPESDPPSKTARKPSPVEEDVWKQGVQETAKTPNVAPSADLRPSVENGAFPPRPPQRLHAAKRQSRLARDSKWADLIENEAAEHEIEREMERLEHLAKLQEQSRLLEQQVRDHERRQREANEATRLQGVQMVEQSQREAERERHARDVEKMNRRKEHDIRNQLLEQRLAQKRDEKNRRLEEERRYADDLRRDDEQRREAEMERKKKTRADLQRFLSDNLRSEQQKRADREAAKERERKEVEEIIKLQKEQEESAMASLVRKTPKASLQEAKQQKIISLFEARRALDEAKRQQEEQKIASIVAERQRKEDLEQAALKGKKIALKSEMFRALNQQVAERDAAVRRGQVSDSYSHARTGLAIGPSPTAERDRNRDRQADLRRNLESQIQERMIREQMETQTKI